MEVMSPLDSAFLRLEDRHTSLHIASIAIFDGPAPSTREMVAVFEGKLPLLPRFRQRVCEVPLHLGQPVWIEDPTFSLGYHLRRTAVPQPGSMSQLRDLVGRLMSQQLDRSKPLWECWIVDGLQDGRWALINKAHHCMVDGIAGTDLLGILLDRSPQASVAATEGWHPQAPPGRVRLLASTTAAAPRRAFDTFRAVAAGARHPRSTAVVLAVGAHGVFDFARQLRVARASSLSGPLGRSRVWADASVSLSEVKQIKQAVGGTVNDVVLAAVTRGFRDLLLQRDEELPDHGIATLVPVSVRANGSGRADNQISAVLAALPVRIAGPLDRLAAVRADLDRLKRSGEAQAGQLLTQAARLVPPVVASLGLTAGFRLPQRVVLTVATNVPGPRGPLFVAGRRLQELYPYVPIADHVRIAIAITSYEGRLYIGVTADRDSTPDIAIVAAGIEDAIRELRRAVDEAA
ncbi:MAG: diacylglycerol O-acyltransferase / wax synthase [Pseudonocardiales bacterium]|nr:diacylglycerol O-acyltransferase / wax synthase [Pseudonocardiales bacterium]